MAGGTAELPGDTVAGLCRVLVGTLPAQKALAHSPSLSPHAFQQTETSQMSRLFKTRLKAWVGHLVNLAVPLFSHACC